MAAPAQDPALDFFQAAQAHGHAGAAVGEIGDLLAGMPLAAADEVGDPGVEFDRHLVVNVAFQAAASSYGMNSCQKGKRGERAWRDELVAHGYTARRGRQFSASPDSPDVVCPDLPGFHFEVKLVEHLNLAGAMAQAIRDAGARTPVVAHKRNRSGWMVTKRAADWFEMLTGAHPGQGAAK